MPRAILKNGRIVLTEPLPAEWSEGQELSVEATTVEADEMDFDEWFRQLEAMVTQNDLADLAETERSIRESRERAKAYVRGQMGLK
jgi:hypothetical protein